jgi:hypothetical protein
MPYLKQHNTAPQNSNISVLGSKGVAAEMGMAKSLGLYDVWDGSATIGSEPCSGTKHAKASEAESAFAVVDRNHSPLMSITIP